MLFHFLRSAANSQQVDIMGSYVSIFNDTGDVIMIKLTLNSAVYAPFSAEIFPITTVIATVCSPAAIGGITDVERDRIYRAVVTGNIEAITTIEKSSLADKYSMGLISGYEKEGYEKVMPGRKWKSTKKTLSLNQRMWLVRLKKDDKGATTTLSANSSVWTGRTANSEFVYQANERKYFRW